MTTPTVHLIDSDYAHSDCLTRLLGLHGYAVEKYSRPSQFISNEKSGLQCVLLDLSLSEVNDWDAETILTRADDKPPVILTSRYANVEISVRAMKAGAVDFLLKPFADDRLLAAVRLAISQSEQAQRRRENFRRDELAFTSLTPREQQVCLRIVQGLLNKQVGYELGTTEKTIKVQRAHVMQKLGAGSLPDVVRLVERLRVAGFSF